MKNLIILLTIELVKGTEEEIECSSVLSAVKAGEAYYEEDNVDNYTISILDNNEEILFNRYLDDLEIFMNNYGHIVK